MRWLPWIIGAVLLAVIVYLIWRSQSRTDLVGYYAGTHRQLLGDAAFRAANLGGVTPGTHSDPAVVTVTAAGPGRT